MKKINWFIVSLLSLLLIACNGSSDDSSSNPDDDAVVTSLTLQTLDADGDVKQSFTKQEVITVVATILDASGNKIAGRTVNFGTGIGELSQASKLSDSSGQAIVTISNASEQVGAGTISVNSDDVTQETSFEYLENETPGTSIELTSQLLLNGVAVNQFKSDEVAEINAELIDSEGNPIVGEIVQFTAEIGTLDKTSGITNSSGVVSATLTGGDTNGAGVLTVSYEQTSQSNLINYEILAADSIIIDDALRIGYVGDDNSFVEGQISLSIADGNISAGGTLGLTVDVVDSEGERVVTPTPVSFSSSCVSNGNATVDASATTVNGRANATFEDINCAGKTGVDDTLVAAITVNGITQTAQASISITGEDLGSIEFVSAEPDSIVLKGTGGQGKQETSTLTFLVKGALGNALPQQEVSFTLDTVVGGISLDPLSGLTNSQGLITTQVTAGTVPAAVRVTASAIATDGVTTVQSQSDLLSVNTGLPSQRTMTIAATQLNPEAINGATSEISVWLSDNFQNPVPDGTTVNFTTEGGNIDPSCTTVGGSCSVTWEASEPRLDDHRTTILAYALGHESFFDTNGNNIFDDADGAANTSDDVSSGFGRIDASATGFFDMSEAWRDDNADNIKDATEPFFDLNNNGAFDSGDGLFNGSQCEGALCAAEGARAANVRKALELVMASSSARWCLSLSSETTRCEDSFGSVVSEGIEVDLVGGVLQVPSGGFTQLTLHFADTAFQTMPVETSVSVNSSVGTVEGMTSINVTNNNNAGYQAISFLLINDGAEVGVLQADITSPNGLITSITLPIQLL